MGFTMAEKILARHAGKPAVEAGELIDVRVDLVMANDITAAPAIKAFDEIGVERVFDPARVVFVSSHFTPAKDIASAQQAGIMRKFARAQGTIYFEIGRGGIEHVVLPEQGLVVPGQVVVGGAPVRGPDRRRIFVFQENGVFPWLTVHDNVGFGVRESDRGKREETISRYIDMVGLSGF